jgi:hypothetical protein
MSVQELRDRIILRLENFDAEKLSYIDTVINNLEDSQQSSLVNHAMQVIKDRSEVLAKLAQ